MLSLGEVGQSVVAQIEAAGQLVFHPVGDNGNTRELKDQSLVAGKTALKAR